MGSFWVKRFIYGEERMYLMLLILSIPQKSKVREGQRHLSHPTGTSKVQATGPMAGGGGTGPGPSGSGADTLGVGCGALRPGWGVGSRRLPPQAGPSPHCEPGGRAGEGLCLRVDTFYSLGQASRGPQRSPEETPFPLKFIFLGKHQHPPEREVNWSCKAGCKC